MTDTFNSNCTHAEAHQAHNESFCGAFPLKQSGQFPNEFSCMGIQAGRIQRAEEGDDLAWNGFTWSTSAVLSLGGVSVALSLPSLSNPQHPLSLSLNHSDPAHLEPTCFSILSSTVVISNQPMGLSLSRHQQPMLLSHLIPLRGMWAKHCTLCSHRKSCFIFIFLSRLALKHFQEQEKIPLKA